MYTSSCQIFTPVKFWHFLSHFISAYLKIYKQAIEHFTIISEKFAVYCGSCDNLPKLWDMSKRDLPYPAYLHGYQKI